MNNHSRSVTENYVYIIDLDVFNLCNKHSDPLAGNCRIDENYAREACELLSNGDWLNGLRKLVRTVYSYSPRSPRGYGAAIIFPNLGGATQPAGLAARCLERAQFICRDYYAGRILSLLRESMMGEGTTCLFSPRIRCKDLNNMVQRCYRGAEYSDKCRRVISAIECIVEGLRNMYGRLRASIGIALFCDKEGSLCSSMIEDGENYKAKYIGMSGDIGAVCVVFADD